MKALEILPTELQDHPAIQQRRVRYVFSLVLANPIESLEQMQQLNRCRSR